MKTIIKNRPTIKNRLRIKEIFNKDILKFNIYYLILFIVHILFDANNNLLSTIDIFLFLIFLLISIILFKKIKINFSNIIIFILNSMILLSILFSYLILTSYISICSSGFCAFYYILTFLFFAITPIVILNIFFIIIFIFKKLQTKLQKSNLVENKK